MRPVIVIHGGAGNITESAVPGKLAGVEAACLAGSNILLQGGSAVDAVIAAVKVMEIDEYFNCGRGSVLNLNGEVEMDAIIMDGSSLATGAVTGVKNIEHASELARLVMERTPHVLLAGEGANDFALKQGVPTIPAYRLVTQAAIDALEAFINQQGSATSELSRPGEVGTVGAVALDVNGRVVVCTSTGGITGKYPGRVGDTPIPGSGGYADNTVGASSATGTGEAIMKTCVTHSVISAMRNGTSPAKACEEAIEMMTARVPGSPTAGVIAVSSIGEIGIYFNSKRMAWSYRQGDDAIQKGIDSLPMIYGQN